MSSVNWNPWHGCHKISPGCLHCYVYRTDSRYEKDASAVYKTGDFDLPVRKKRDGTYKVPSGSLVWTCFTSDFLLEDADEWRKEAWDMIRERSDLHFLFITKRITRFYECIPDDWGDGWDNVTVYCTCENQAMADMRLPVYAAAPIKHKKIICEPCLEYVDFKKYLSPEISFVSVGGESGNDAREMRYEWALAMRDDCISCGAGFEFRQTGAVFVKDGRRYIIPRKYQHSQAKKANINVSAAKKK